MVYNTKVISLKDAKEYTIMEKSQVSLAQKNLKNLPENTELAEKILKTVIESWSKDGFILGDVARCVNDYCVFSSINNLGESMKQYENEIKFVKSIKNNEDFCSAVIIKEDINNIWILIKDASFKYNKIYLQSARNFRNDNECEFNITIFDESQVQDMNEQLESYKNYKVIDKNA